MLYLSCVTIQVSYSNINKHVLFCVFTLSRGTDALLCKAEVSGSAITIRVGRVQKWLPLSSASIMSRASQPTVLLDSLAYFNKHHVTNIGIIHLPCGPNGSLYNLYYYFQQMKLVHISEIWALLSTLILFI